MTGVQTCALPIYPLKRALRCDKMTLAALEATLMQYRNPATLDVHLPIFKKLSRPLSELAGLAQQLISVCHDFSALFEVSVQASQTQVGSGSQPDVLLDSLSLCFSPKPESPLSLLQLDNLFKTASMPIIGRLANNRLWLDLRGCDNEAQLEGILSQLGRNLANGENLETGASR